MTTPIDSHPDGTMPIFAENSMGTLRLYNLDLPVLKNAGRTSLEQLDASTIHRVIDIACGAGAWAINTAQAYPQMQVVGIDISAQGIDSARAQAHTSGLNNTSFMVMDPLQPLGFPDASFDLINARFISSLVPTAAWPVLLQECLRITRPGGTIQLTDGDMPVTSSPAFEKLSGMIALALLSVKHNFSPDGQTFIIAPMLIRLLQNVGYVGIRRTPHMTNFSTGMPAHADMYQDFSDTYRLVQPLLIKMGVTTQQEVDQVYQQMLAEMQSDSFCAVGFYLTVWGKKP